MGTSPTNTTCISNHTRPRNERELFNLHHSSLRNVIEHIFGVLKRQWRILDSPPEYDMHIQARVPAALCVVHNFIRHFDADAFNDLEVDWDYMRFIEDGELPPDAGNKDLVQEEQAGGDAAERRDAIARAMWEDYISELARRGRGPPT